MRSQSQPKRRGALRVAVVVLLPLSLLLLASDLLADAPAAKSSAKVPAQAAGFDHEGHAERLKDKDCTHCHVLAASAKPAPTTRSHAPCLASGCHIDEFLSTGPRTKKDDPAAFAAAATFCGLCHKSKAGEPPQRFAKAPADALFEDKSAANFHVEMDHHAHTKRTSCSTCHVVDSASFSLKAGRPNHVECKTCHDEDSEKPMSMCSTCHSAPGPATYFTKTRKRSDVRVCVEGGTGTRACFKHERTEHRFDKETPLECSSCHYMFQKKKYNGKSYASLADVKAAPIIDNRRDMAHKSCGASGCHKKAVDDSMGTGKCGLCHSQEFMASSLVD